MEKVRFLIAGVLGIALCGSATAMAAAQTMGPSVTTAHIVVTVEPKHGPNAPVVTRDDVMVYEGKNRERVVNWIPAQGDHATLQLFIMIDDEANTNLGIQLGDIKQFIEAQPATTLVGVAYMQNGIAEVEQNPTSDHALAIKALRLPMGYAGANASPYFSLVDLIKRWPATDARRAVLMVSDGIDRYYGAGDFEDPYLQDAIDQSEKAGIHVSAIYTPGTGHFSHSYWLNYWGQLYLANLADKTGGEAYYIGFTGAPVAFAPYLKDMADRLQHQYFLEFVPQPQKKAGWQRVRVTTEVKGVDLVSPRKVWVSPQE